MLAKAEDSSFPPLSRRYMLDWVMEQLEMFARIPPCPAREYHSHFTLISFHTDKEKVSATNSLPITT